jgi:hypothetical protein
MSDAKDLPPCFGFILSYDKKDATCIACHAYRECGLRVGAQLAETRPVSEKPKAIRAVAPRPEKASRTKAAIDEGHEKIVAAIAQKKPAEIVRRVLSRGMTGASMLVAMRSGENPFAGRPPKFLETTCDLLISGGYSRAQLVAAFMDSGMSRQTAYSHVAIASVALSHLGVITEEAGRFGLINHE